MTSLKHGGNVWLGLDYRGVAELAGLTFATEDLPGPIRNHQSGGLPIHNAPARHHPLSRPPPRAASARWPPNNSNRLSYPLRSAVMTSGKVVKPDPRLTRRGLLRDVARLRERRPVPRG
jgi:hypothetical protein